MENKGQKSQSVSQGREESERRKDRGKTRGTQPYPAHLPLEQVKGGSAILATLVPSVSVPGSALTGRLSCKGACVKAGGGGAHLGRSP